MCTAASQTNNGLHAHKRDFETKRKNEDNAQDQAELAFTNATHLQYTGKNFE